MARIDENEELIQALINYTHQNHVLTEALTATLTNTLRETASLSQFTHDIQKIGKELGQLTGQSCMNYLSDSLKDFTNHFVQKIGTLTSRLDKITQTQEQNQQTVDAVIQSQLLIAQNLKELSDRLVEQNKRISRLENAITFVFEAQASAIKDQQPAKKS
ncbi:hypothetical protein ACWATR_38310 [Nostoc sp. UIC 10890]